MCHRLTLFVFSNMKVERSGFNITHQGSSPGVVPGLQNRGQEQLTPQDGAGGDVWNTASEPWFLECPQRCMST